MHVKVLDDHKVWDEFILQNNLNTFLHSLAWKNFNTLDGHKTWTLGLYNHDNQLVSISLIIKVEAKRGWFLFCPHGPISKNVQNSKIINESAYQEELKTWLEYLQDLGKIEKVCFIRFQPIVLKSETSQNIYSISGFRPAPIHMHTELTTVLDIERNFEDIILGMRKTTRQMVKKGEDLLAKKEVTLEIYDHITDDVWKVYESTSERGKFVGYSRKFLQREFDSFKDYAKVHLYGFRYQGKLLSWGMVLKSGKRAFYHQGGNQLDKAVPSSYMCQWEGIKWAKSQGCVSYDFWGVAPSDKPNHPWAKISLFKRGFGGEDVELLHAQDYILNFKYWFNWLIETYRAKKRGFSE